MIDMEDGACDLLVATNRVHVVQIQLAKTIRANHVQ